jgi:pSer/pThr/pTyr-binding forkhead associated (FHA) protein
MSRLEFGGTKFTIPVGEVALGSDASCAVVLAGVGIMPRHALLQGQTDGQVIIRKATPAAELLINGVRLGAEPTPLLHGDKVELGGLALTFVDESRSGSTRFVEKAQVPGAQVRPGGSPAVTANTGGRIVSLTDGREYLVTAPPLVFGRDAGCDVVVAGKDVSRRHAEIVPTPKGYLLVDSSTNGTFVNEEQVQGQRMLQRADVIRIGDETFRFHADVPPAAAASAAPPPGGAERLEHGAHGLAAVPRDPGPLASFLLKGGALEGQRLQVWTPVANIGRADYNDLVLPDASVSTAHAKLQRREGVWVIVDLDSTNGTFVDGERVKGESPLAPGTIVRFGTVDVVFEPMDDMRGIALGGGTKVLGTAQPAPVPMPHKAAPPARQEPRARTAQAAPTRPRPKRPVARQAEKKGKGCGASAAALLLAAAGVVAFHRLLA